MPPLPAAFRLQLLALGLGFALLVGNTAAGLASGLARSLALTAATVLCALAQITSFDSLNVFHVIHPTLYFLSANYDTTIRILCQ